MNLYARRSMDDNENEDEDWIQKTFQLNRDDETNCTNNGYASSSSVSLMGDSFAVDASYDASALEYSESDRSRCSSPLKVKSLNKIQLLDAMDSDNESMTSQDTDLFLNDSYFLSKEDFLGKMEMDDESVEYPPSVSDEGTREGSSVNTNTDDEEELQIFQDSSDDNGVFEDNPDSSFDAPFVVPYQKLGSDEAFHEEKGSSFARRLLRMTNKDNIRTMDDTNKKGKQPSMLKRAVRSFRRRSNRDKPSPSYLIESSQIANEPDLTTLVRHVSSPESIASPMNHDLASNDLRRDHFAQWQLNKQDVEIVMPPTLKSIVDSNTNIDVFEIFCSSSDSSSDHVLPMVSDDDAPSSKQLFMLEDEEYVSREEESLSCSTHLLYKDNTNDSIPEGLLSRLSLDDIISQLHLGVNGWTAIHCLEQMTSVASELSPFEISLPMLTVQGVKVPDYNAYVTRNVNSFRRDILSISHPIKHEETLTRIWPIHSKWY